MAENAKNKDSMIRCSCAREQLLVPATPSKPTKTGIQQPDKHKLEDVVGSDGGDLDSRDTPASGPKSA